MTVTLREDFFHLFRGVASPCSEGAEKCGQAIWSQFRLFGTRVDQLEETRTFFTHLIRPELVDQPMKIFVLFLRRRHAVEFTL
ncbi:hypothetical protein BJ982_000153 [Sphaerisporangium siamense]|uniref:Uncharacterized protein n=1 Tax=Sphaerisporangium siamense TaxID=795645 RepID=A0A7W7D1I2_9ACTN|nr:hypothetical protein [Sphaerisporangium siamense]MBB4698609.1 hypothetical protein [Sphaerisporangium siamense]